MTHLFYFYSCFNYKFLGSLLDEAITLSKNEDNKVFFAYCGGVNRMCIFNQGGSKLVCKLCSICTKKILEKYGFVPLSAKNFSNAKIDNSICIYKNADDIRNITYKDAKIGLGIMSTYISITRNMSPLINKMTRHFFDNHIKQNVRFVDAIYNLIDGINPDVLYAYNGRFEDSRPIYDIGIKLNLKTVLMEDDKVEGKSYKLKYINHLPHDIEYINSLMTYCWDNYKMTYDEKVNHGADFYIRRRAAKPSGDVKIYIENQRVGYAPKFDMKKRNIAIMVSSEDEFAAVGGQWDNLKLFKTQLEGINYMLKNAPNDMFFYIRVHPNLKDIPYKYHTDIGLIEDKYSNVEVVPADSSMSTYTIMEQCEKIVTFGSTMGIESSYWGKPSILLGPSLYYYGNVTYNPKTKEELLSLLSQNLSPIKSDYFYVFGAFTIDSSPLHVNVDNIDVSLTEHKLFGLSFTTSPFMSLWINPMITSLFIGFLRLLFDNSLFRRYRVPKEEA